MFTLLRSSLRYLLHSLYNTKYTFFVATSVQVFIVVIEKKRSIINVISMRECFTVGTRQAWGKSQVVNSCETSNPQRPLKS